MPTTPKDILARMKAEEIHHADFRITDAAGVVHHVTMHENVIDEDSLTSGFMFDGSSIRGWKAINESDMIMRPDLETAVMDPFYVEPTLAIFCDVIEPMTGQPYDRCPRSISHKAMAYLSQTGVGDSAFFGPEAEFFVFDDVRYSLDSHNTFFQIDASEAPHRSGQSLPEGNLGHRPRTKGGYFPVNPVDSGQDLRTEMLAIMAQMGVEVEKHHHEVATSQHELGIKFGTMIKAADSLQLYKYVVRNVAHSYGKTATFMPKPLFGDNGSGMHVHQSLWNKGQALFPGDGYAGLSQTALYYVGGIIKHARALNAFTNPTTNSYKRLVPGYEAPVLLAYSSRNRSASCRIPYVTNAKARRVEVRFPDPCANPYLAFAAMLMAGLDGIANKIDPGAPRDQNLYALPPEELAQIPTVCSSLEEAIGALAEDHAFLLKGNVFTKDFVDSYLDLKREEWDRFRMTPHPVEYDMYYSS